MGLRRRVQPMNDDESQRLINLALAWVELREHITATIRNPNVLGATVQVEIRLLELISAGERDAIGRSAVALKALRQLQG